jgi:serine/threonine protein kinase
MYPSPTQQIRQDAPEGDRVLLASPAPGGRAHARGERPDAEESGRLGSRSQSLRERASLVIPPGTEVRGFLVESELGAGGFGTVYRARRGERLYALKFIHRKAAGGWAQREVESLLRVSHRNVVGFEGCGFWPDDTREYLVVFMDYVDGRRLDVWAQEKNPDARQVAWIVLGVARALVEIHGVTVFHRDLKEANIIVRASDGEAVLVDFGVAGGTEPGRATRDVLPPCTLEYRAPEAWRFLRERARRSGSRYQPGPADDLYALGVVLYWLLTGRWPCVGATEVEQAEVTLHHVPEPPHVTNPRVPEVLSAICMKLLEKQPENRYPDAAALSAAVEAARAGADDAWSVPLCDPHAPDNVTTVGSLAREDDVEPVDHWLRGARHSHERPRRGKRSPAPAGAEEERPPLSALEAVPAPAPPAPEPSPAEPSQVEPLGAPAPEAAPQATSSASGAVHPIHGRAVNVPLRVTGGLVFAVVVSLGVAWPAMFHPRTAASPPASARVTEEAQAGSFMPNAEATWELGWKVAPPWKPPEASRRDFVTEEVVLVAPSTWSEKGDASMKNPQQKQQKGLGPVGKAITAACLTMAACTGPQVRPEPQAEECPPGAVENMEKLGIKVGTKGQAKFPPRGEPRPVTVKEGWSSSLYLYGGWKNLPRDTILAGKLIFGERVYGRFTEARLPEGKGGGTVRVCMELLDTGGDRGLELEPGSTEGNLKVFSAAQVRAVDRFE